ncbi:unnamed protein product [Durusdinium trenchii]|uniref:Uncharacterized protein n=1 Tax=Durusdinium trenchii TaxID=1381693 RepID=A0ABP0P981_9DINO
MLFLLCLLILPGRAEMDLELIDEDGVARRDRSAGTPAGPNAMKLTGLERNPATRSSRVHGD